MKIAVVNMEEVLQAHPDTKEAEKIIQRQVTEFDAEKAGLVEKFESMRKEFERVRSDSENKALNENGRLQKRREAERKLEEMRDFDEEVRQTTLLRQRQIKERKGRLRARIVADIRAVIRDYAQKNGYAMILDSGALVDDYGVVVYNVEAMDLTRVIAKVLTETRKPTLTEEDGKAEPAPKPRPAAIKAE
jgi:Skp family chaperone for outer membrane proteins